MTDSFARGVTLVVGRKWGMRLCAAVVLGVAVLLCLSAGASTGVGLSSEASGGTAPSLFWVFPFVCILLVIAIFPLVGSLSHWWECNRNKLLVSLALAALTCGYYALRGYGFGGSAPGIGAIGNVLRHSILGDYIPFIVLLFSLYTISGGIRLAGDIPAHPLTNCVFLFVGAVLASLIGTTGASVLLIRPLLEINSERRHVKHTVIFFIFMVSNIGGSLLPVGDPPLFLGYLRGVPFVWTLHLLPAWAVATGILLAVYCVFDSMAYRKEAKAAIQLDETQRKPLTLSGKGNFLLLAGVVAAVALLVPGRRIPMTPWVVPDIYLREAVQLVLAGVSLTLTPRRIHTENGFNFSAISEVACLFVGIFITMQVPIEILKLKGEALGVTSPLQFFWASGALSSFLDNAPTYVVFFELAGSLHVNGDVLANVATATGSIAVRDLLAISCGSVFMGANSYIGNGPNFLVKSIAEHQGVRMPSFFGYMVYSGLILIPTFVVISVLFFV